MKILITGSKGQLGRELARQLKDRTGMELVMADIDELDITDATAVDETIRRIAPDMVINCAAQTQVDLCEEDRESARNINTKGASNLAEASHRNNAAIIHISTDYVFDGTRKEPYTEDDETNPLNIYGITKLEGEKEVMSGNPRHFVIRTAWLYGDGRNFVGTMLQLAEKGNTIKVVDDQRGSPTSTTELARAIIRLMDTEEYGIYHGTCEGSCTWYEFAQEIFRTAGMDVTLERCTSDEFPQKAVRPKNSVLDNRNFRERLGYRFLSWQEALREYLKGES